MAVAVEKTVERFLVCTCHCLAHMVYLNYYKDEPDQVWFSVHMQADNFWGRVKNAFNHIRNKPCTYGYWAEVLLDREQANHLIEFLEEFVG